MFMKNTLKLSVVAAMMLAQPLFTEAQHRAPFGAPGGHAVYAGNQVAAKNTTGNGSRLIAQQQLSYDTLTHNYVPYVSNTTDSSVYTYSGGRGGDFEWPTGETFNKHWKPDTYKGYSNNPVSHTSTQKQTATINYNSFGDWLSYQAQQWVPATSSWRNTSRDTFMYDGLHNLITEEVRQWDTSSNSWVNYAQTNYTYTSANKIATEVDKRWSSGTWVGTFMYTYTYNSSSQVTSQIQLSWSTSLGIWDTPYKDTFIYAGANLVEARHYDFQPTTSLWVPWGRDSFYNFTGSRPQTSIDQSWNSATSSWVNGGQTQFTYNSFYQSTSGYYAVWDPASNSYRPIQGRYGYRNYYETYVTAVNNITTENGTTNVYPVPAQNEINLDITWNESQPFTITVVDMLGNIASKTEVPACQHYTAKQSVIELEAGNYIINVEGAKGRIVRMITVTK